jgi:hypothetical protein
MPAQTVWWGAHCHLGSWVTKTCTCLVTWP